MDVSRVLDLVRPFFESRAEPYALVGGLALLAYGAPRATFDVDLLAPRRTREDLVAFLEGRGFTTLSVQPGFSNHQHPDPALGRVDVIYVSGTTADAVFAGCSRKAIAAAVEAPVPRPEHLLAMKAQAFAKDQLATPTSPTFSSCCRFRSLDLVEARGYFESAGLAEYFERLRRR